MQVAQATERFADAAIFDEMVRPDQNLTREQELMLLEELAELLTQSPIGLPLN